MRLRSDRQSGSLISRGLSLEAECEGLAQLSPLEYEQRRQDVAKKHRVRVTGLDKEVQRLRKSEDAMASENMLGNEITPWSKPVDICSVLDGLRGERPLGRLRTPT